MKFPVTINEKQFRTIAYTAFAMGFLTAIGCALLLGALQ